MEGNTNWKPNEQGGDSLVKNANDWRSQHDPDHIRKKVLFKIVEDLKIYFPNHSQNEINESAVKFEDKVYGMSIDKRDYVRKIMDKLMTFGKKFRNVQSNNVQPGSSVNRTNTSEPAAHVLNQEQSLPTSLPYTQTLTSQQWLPQNIQSNLSIRGSSGLPTQVPITVSVVQNVNIQMDEGVHSNHLPGSQRQMQESQQLLPQQQQPEQHPQNSNYMFQHQTNQQLLKEKIRHGNLRPPHTQQPAQPPQQQHHQQSLLKQPIQQQLPHQTSLSTTQLSFPQSSALSSLPSSGQQTSIQQNSQFLPRHQSPTQRVRSSNQQQMAALSQEQKQQEREKLISQLMNGPNTQQNHLTSRKNNGEQQGAFRVSLSQQNNIASFQAISQQNDNLQNMHQQRLRSNSNNASALPSQQQQTIPGGQSGNLDVAGSSLLGTPGQEVGQSQPMMLQQYQPQHPVQQQQPPQNRSLPQHLDSVQNDTQRFQAAGSLRQTQNIADQQYHPHQLQRPPWANPSTSQDSTGKTVNASGEDWQEETYQKIKALRKMYLPVLSTMLQKVVEKLRQIDSLPQQMMLYESTEKLRAGKSTLELVIVFLNVHRSSVSEKHRDRFSIYEEHVLRLTKSRSGPRRPMQQPPSQFHGPGLQSQSPQVHGSQSLDKDQMNSRLMQSNQNGASSSVSGLTTSQTAMPHSLKRRPKMELKDENNIMASSGNVVLPSLKQIPASNPQVIHSNINLVQSSMFQPQQQHHQKQFHDRQMQQQPLQQQEANQQLQMQTSHQTNEMNDVRMRQGINIKAGFLQQHLSSSQRQIPKPLASPPSASSPQIQHNSSPQLVDQQILPKTVNKSGTTWQSGGSPVVAPSPVTSFAPSPIPGDPEKPISVESPVPHAYRFQTSAQSPSSIGIAIKSSLDFHVKHGDQEHPPFTRPPEPIAERPIDRLVKAFQSSSRKSLAESVSEMSSVISMADMIAGSFPSGGGSRAGLGEDLSEDFRLQEGNLMTRGETNPTKRLKRSISTRPLDIYKQFSSLESEVDSTASSGSKVNKIEPGCALLQEIKEINGRHVETVVDILCDERVYPSEVTSGIIVTCSYAPVALSATFKAHYKSGHISQIQPLRLLVPANYPYSSPILVEKIHFDASVHKYEDLSATTRSRFSLSMKELSEPMSLKDIVQVWNDCARATVTEYAERYGGGTFSSKYGTWETLLRAS